MNRAVMTPLLEVEGGREPGWARPDDSDPLSRRLIPRRQKRVVFPGFQIRRVTVQ